MNTSDKLREALELIRWSNDSKWQTQCAAEALAADDAARGTMQSLAAENERLRTALRFYARGEHYMLDESEEFDTVSGEPENWLCSGREDSATMIENGRVALFALRGIDINWRDGDEDGTPQPVEGEQAATRAAAPQSAEPADAPPGYMAALADAISRTEKLPPPDLSGDPRVDAPSAPTDAQWAKQAYEMADALCAHLSTRPQQATEADRLDAQRYRWLRDNDGTLIACLPPSEMDAAIDAAMSAQAGGKGQGS